MSAKNVIAVAALVVVALFAVYVWPTRYSYSSEKTAEDTHVIRIDRFSDRVWILTPQGWLVRSANPLDGLFSTDPYAQYGGRVLPPQTSAPVERPSPAPTSTSASVSLPKATEPKHWATVNDDTSVFKHCHFDAGSRTNVDGCDFNMVDSDPFPSAITVLKKGERVGLLSDRIRASGGKDIYKVKFQQWTGWMDADDLTLE